MKTLPACVLALSVQLLVSPMHSFSVVEATIPDLQRAMKEKRVTSRQIVQQYLDRIEKYNGSLNTYITLNPHALEDADASDRERAAGHVRGPLRGIPIAIKDNIQTTDMPTTAGALAFKDFVPPYEATLTRNLRASGAIIIAKTTMTELANWIAQGMPNNYSSLAGFALNPYDPRPDPRPRMNDGRPVLNTGGSSSGAGTTVSFWAASVGTETSGSILSPANANMLAAIKPTVGRISRYGVIPITADQDTPGPMARTITDAALLLGVLEGSVDPNDPATRRCDRPRGNDYTRFLKTDALRRARIGVPRAYFHDDLQPDERRLMEEALAILKREGAILVDPADLPSVISSEEASAYQKFPLCAGSENAKGLDAGCSSVLKYGMKRDFNIWLRTLGPSAPVKTLTELRQFNLAHVGEGALKFGQAQLDISDEIDLDADTPRYLADRAKDIRLSATDGIDAVVKGQKLDALLFPSIAGYDIAARAGYPTVMVPFGFAANPPQPAFPDGFDAKPSPFGISFTGTACSEPRLIALAYAFEQVTRRRVSPPLFP